MKILIHSKDGAGTIITDRLEREGHQVKAFVKDFINKDYLEGIVDLVSSIEEGLNFKPDLIVFDAVGDGDLADKLKAKGYPVFGAGKFNDKLEEDRSYGLEVMKKVGINIPDTYEFSNQKEGLDFIKKNPIRYVIKLDDNKSCFSSYVGKSADDMINMLTHFYDEGLIKDGDEYILQEFIEGFEVATEGFFDGEKFIPELFNHTIEEKKFMTGNLGPTTGSMGCLVWFPEYRDSKQLIDNTMKMENILRENNYRGQIDVNTIVDKNGNMWALEHCCRMGFVSIENIIDLYEGDFGELLYGIATGNVGKVKVSKDMCIGVLVTVPPFPISDIPEDVPKEEKKRILQFIGKRSHNLLIKGIDKVYPHTFFYGVKKDDNGNYRVGSDDGHTLSICGRGKTLKEAKDLAYKRVDMIELPEKQYRIDIGDRANKYFDEIMPLLNKKNKFIFKFERRKK